MSIFVIPLIEDRLRDIARELVDIEVVIHERADTFFNLVKRFNASRNIKEKSRLASAIEVERRKMTTWVERSDKAWKRKSELQFEQRELSSELFILRMRHKDAP